MNRANLSDVIAVTIMVSAVLGMVGALLTFAPLRMKLYNVASALLVLCMVSSLAAVALAVWWLFL